MAVYNINGENINIKVSEFSGSLSTDEYAKQIDNALAKIGVKNKFIHIDCGGLGNNSYAYVEWSINGKVFNFRCDSQQHQYKNMGAIAQAIQEDVRQITRGIKNIDVVMRQYEALPSYNTAESDNKLRINYSKMSKEELKQLLKINHPDIAKSNYDKDKFFNIKEALREKEKVEEEKEE